jgi:hypothetical protein
MTTILRQKSYLGSVIEFRLTHYFVYGLVFSENKSLGDSLLMFSPKFADPIENIELLYQTPIRCKFLFFAKLVAQKKNADILRIVGQLRVDRIQKIDTRFRVSLEGLAGNSKWQILDEGTRTVVPFLTTETALLSDADLPNVDYIKQYYDADHYPWCAALTRKGATNFDTDQFELEMRRRLK